MRTKGQKNRDRQLARSWFVAGRLFDFRCERCGCEGSDIAEKCTAPLDAVCPGFAAMEKAADEFEKNYGRIIGPITS